MLAEERLLRITDLLNQRDSGIVSVSELSDWLGVSPMTIRRDLNRLESMDVLRRVHGGAVAYHTVEDWKPFVERHGEFSREKQAIGWAAAQLVDDGEVVLLDAGTTTPHVARHLAYKNDVAVVTHSLAVADELTQHLKVSTVLLGGDLWQKERCTGGAKVIAELERLSVDRFFLSAAGYTAEDGATDFDADEIEVKRAMMRAARDVVLVADSSKWCRRNAYQIAPWGQIRRLVVDDGIPAEAIEMIRAAGVDVVTPSLLASKTVSRRVLHGI